MGGKSHMKTKYLLIISIFIILMSMTCISASENVNQTDSLGLSIEDNFDYQYFFCDDDLYIQFIF